MVAAPMGPRATGSDSRGERLNKLRILLLALAYACFWSLFVLFPYPANVLPESHASYVAGPVFASNLRSEEHTSELSHNNQSRMPSSA